MSGAAVTTKHANPTLSTILEVEAILQREATKGDASPLSISELERRMDAKRTRRETIKTAVEALVHYGVAAVGSKGVVYTRTSKRMAAAPTFTPPAWRPVPPTTRRTRRRGTRTRSSRS